MFTFCPRWYNNIRLGSPEFNVKFVNPKSINKSSMSDEILIFFQGGKKNTKTAENGINIVSGSYWRKIAFDWLFNMLTHLSIEMKSLCAIYIITKRISRQKFAESFYVTVLAAIQCWRIIRKTLLILQKFLKQ